MHRSDLFLGQRQRCHLLVCCWAFYSSHLICVYSFFSIIMLFYFIAIGSLYVSEFDSITCWYLSFSSLGLLQKLGIISRYQHNTAFLWFWTGITVFKELILGKLDSLIILKLNKWIWVFCFNTLWVFSSHFIVLYI